MLSARGTAPKIAHRLSGPARQSARAMSVAAAPGGAAPVVVWYRNDLRVRDNELLALAADMCRDGSASGVLPVFCFDPRFFAASAWGTPKTGPFRAQFLVESVADLKRSLRGVGSDLLVAVGRPEDVIPRAAGGPCTVLTQQETTSEELAVDKAVRGALPGGSRFRAVWGSTLYHVDDLPFADDLADLPDVFTPFRNKVEAKCAVRAEARPVRGGDLPLPAGLGAALSAAGLDLGAEPSYDALPFDPPVPPREPDPRAALRFAGGEGPALDRLRYYLWGDKQLVASYFDIRNGMLGGDYSTKLAPWLAHGCLSPRTVYWELKKFEEQVSPAAAGRPLAPPGPPTAPPAPRPPAGRPPRRRPRLPGARVTAGAGEQEHVLGRVRAAVPGLLPPVGEEARFQGVPLGGRER